MLSPAVRGALAAAALAAVVATGILHSRARIERDAALLGATATLRAERDALESGLRSALLAARDESLETDALRSRNGQVVLPYRSTALELLAGFLPSGNPGSPPCLLVQAVPGSPSRERALAAVPATTLERLLEEAVRPPSRGALVGAGGEVVSGGKGRRLPGDRVLDRIARGEPCVLRPDGLPPLVEDPAGGRRLALWSEVKGLPGIHVLVEITEANALGLDDAGALPLPGLRRDRFPPWALCLALAVVLTVAAAAAWIPRESPRTRILLRVARFAARYRGSIAVVVGIGVARSLTGLLRIPIGASLVDEVLVPSVADPEGRLWTLAWTFVAVGGFMAATGFVADILLNRCGARMLAELRIALGSAVVRRPLSFFHEAKSGEIFSRIDRDVGFTSDILRLSFDTVLVEPFVLVGALLLAFALNWRLAAVLLLMPLVVYPLLLAARRIREGAERRQILGAAMSQALLQMITGIKVVKAFRGEGREIARLEETNRRFFAENLKVLRLFSLSKSALEAFQVVGTAAIMVLGGYLVLGGEVTLGEMTAFMAIVTQVYKSCKDLVSTFNRVSDSIPGAARAFEILDAPPAVDAGTRTLPKGPLATGIEFRGVRFRYRETEVLRGIDLRIAAGEVLAVVGPTGAGKTTLCDLLPRFHDPTEGKVLVEGIDARELSLDSLRGAVAIVPQDAFLFHATVEENIAYGRPGATREEVVEAARRANIHEEILAMEGGYDRVLGERGASVSGGERQRIAIARALLADAPVLILDEATSSLDSPSEAKIQEALPGLLRGRTVLIIAHRLSTVRDADRVVVLRDGRIVEEGPPEALLGRSGGHFRDLFEGQRVA